MKTFSREPETSTVPGPDSIGTADLPGEAIPGDRGIPSISRVRSMQSRVTSALAISLMTLLGTGLLTWYYARALSRPAASQQAAQATVKNRAQGEMALPSLGPIRAPFLHKENAPPPPPPPESDATTMEKILGPAPPLPPAVVVPAMSSSATPASPPTKSPGELAFERRLAGPAFARMSKDESSPAPIATAASGPDMVGYSAVHPAMAGSSDSADPQALNAYLRPTVTPAVAASVLPARRFLLAKGAFIDCTLETAIDSTLPGMTTCITATDTFSADGSVVLLERGTKLVGETRGQVAQGMSRLFVLWTEARTPTGVVVPLSSPGTDELGRAGLSGEVNRHFFDRFGAAILLTVINGAVQAAVNAQTKNGSVVVSPSATSDVMSEVLRGTINIPPTITKAQGDRIQVFVARDVDFRPVYALKVANLAPGGITP
jgi:type IV secretion system protein VirB10